MGDLRKAIYVDGKPRTTLLNNIARWKDDGVQPAQCLHFAAAKGDYETLEMLLEAGADPNMVNDNGHTVLKHYCDKHKWCGDTMKEIKLLLKKGATLKINDPPTKGYNLAHSVKFETDGVKKYRDEILRAFRDSSQTEAEFTKAVTLRGKPRKGRPGAKNRWKLHYECAGTGVMPGCCGNTVKCSGCADSGAKKAGNKPGWILAAHDYDEGPVKPTVRSTTTTRTAATATPGKVPNARRAP